MEQFADELLGKQTDIFRDQCHQQLQNEPLRTFAIFPASDNLAEDGGHLIRSAPGNVNPVVAEDWLLPNRQEEVERRNILRQLSGFDAINRIEQLYVEVVDPEFIEIAKDHEWRPLGNNVSPIIESLVVMLFEILAA